MQLYSNKDVKKKKKKKRKWAEDLNVGFFTKKKKKKPKNSF